MENKHNRAAADTISVIVPVYKVEAYLPACIDSILAQTHRDFQLILVDDGSPDRCGAICDEYAARDSRILVIHQENGGLSAARNAGIDWVFANSESRWLNFIDSDDLVSPVYLETLYRQAVENNAEIAVTGGFYFSDEQELEHASDCLVSVSTMSSRESCRAYFDDREFFYSTAWGKLFRRELFEGLRFPVGKIYEDEALAPILLHRASRVTVIYPRLYRYRLREGSIIRSAFTGKKFDSVWACENYVRYFRSCGEQELAKLAAARRDAYWAECIFAAWKAQAMDQIPAEFRMTVWRAAYIVARDTLRRGGLKFVLERLGHLFEKIIGKR